MQNRSQHSQLNMRLKAILALLLAALIYGGNVITGRLIAGKIPPLTLSAIRVILALIILLPLAWSALKKAPKPNANELLLLAGLSVLGISFPYISLLLGLERSTGTNASVIFATLPAVTNTLLYLIYKTKPSKFQTIGMVMSFLGLVIVFTHGQLFHLFSFKLGIGELFLFMNVVSVSLFNILGRNMAKKFSSLVVSVYTFIFATLMLVPFGMWQLRSYTWQLSWSSWLIILYMGFCAAGIAFFLNLYGIDKIGSGQASIVNNMQHVFSISLSILVLNETLAVYHWLGFFLVISGVVLSLSKTPPSLAPFTKQSTKSPVYKKVLTR